MIDILKLVCTGADGLRIPMYIQSEKAPDGPFQMLTAANTVADEARSFMKFYERQGFRTAEEHAEGDDRPENMLGRNRWVVYDGGDNVVYTFHIEDCAQEEKPKLKKIGSEYPNGPCNLPLECSKCGTAVTPENAKSYECGPTGSCEICDYCCTLRCPKCGEHVCCGGCI